MSKTKSKINNTSITRAKIKTKKPAGGLEAYLLGRRNATRPKVKRTKKKVPIHPMQKKQTQIPTQTATQTATQTPTTQTATQTPATQTATQTPTQTPTQTVQTAQTPATQTPTQPPATDPTKDTDKTPAKKKGTGRYKLIIFFLLVAIGIGVYFSVTKKTTEGGGNYGNIGGGGWVESGTESSESAKPGTIVVGVIFFVTALVLSIYRLSSKDYSSPNKILEKAAVAAEEGSTFEEKNKTNSELNMAAGHGATYGGGVAEKGKEIGQGAFNKVKGFFRR